MPVEPGGAASPNVPIAVAVVDGNVLVSGVEPPILPRRNGACPARSARLVKPRPSTSTTQARDAVGRPSVVRASAAPGTASTPRAPATAGRTVPRHGQDD